MSGRLRSSKWGGAATRVSKPNKKWSDGNSGEAPEPLQIGSSSSLTGKTQPSSEGNQTKQKNKSTPANVIDFKQFLLESDIPLPSASTDTLASSTVHNHTSHPLPATAQDSETTGTTADFNSFNSPEEMLRLAAEDMTSHIPAQLCEKIWSYQYINIALLLKVNVELQDLSLGGILHITNKGQL